VCDGLQARCKGPGTNAVVSTAALFSHKTPRQLRENLRL